MEQTEITTSANRTFAAIASPSGNGAIALIRISGPQAIEIVARSWQGRNLANIPANTATFGRIIDRDGEVIDETVTTVFHAPHSFTGDDTVEISCHASAWIQNRILNILIDNGASPARPGEFSQRAFTNGKIDLAEAEGIADLIAASSQAAQRIAMSQMKGRFSTRLSELRQSLIELAALMELELDFSEEDVEFADRSHLIQIADDTLAEVRRLAGSFAIGQAIKNGIPVAITGTTNVGKSTLLNNLLGDDKAIVSPVHGTTRDIIEDTTQIDGLLFRFIDTAGLRHTDDIVENIGINRTIDAIHRASLILWLIDPTGDIDQQIINLKQSAESLSDNQKLIILITKADIEAPQENILEIRNRLQTVTPADTPAIVISAISGQGIDQLRTTISRLYSTHNDSQQIIITNSRHYDTLRRTEKALARVIDSLTEGIPTDLVAQDIREATHTLGEITGEITTTDLLTTIFSRFCIGK